MADIISGLALGLGTFSSPAPGQWNLVKGVFTNKKNPTNSVVFFTESRSGDAPGTQTALEQITDGGGRRLATYEYPYKDGQRLKDLGRIGETYTFMIKFWGPNHQNKFREFKRIVIDSKEAGILSHPVLSAALISPAVRLSTYEFIHRHDEFNAITLRAVFREDNDESIDFSKLNKLSPDTALRNTMQKIIDKQTQISSDIARAAASLLLPASANAQLKNRIDSITGQASRLLGQLGVSFGSDAKTNQLLANASQLGAGIADLNSGTVIRTGQGQNTSTVLPPVFQVGFDETTLAAVEQQVSSYVNANQIDSQQAVYTANQARAQISVAISEAESSLGNEGYEVVLGYREMSVAIQEAVEAAIATAQSFIKVYVVPQKMSLRMVAYKNGLSVERQNDLESLNPFLQSVNLIEAGTRVTVPVA